MAKERESWGNKVESFLAVLGYIIGLGNIWRFPYMCFKNGGGAFLIPYSICAILIGLPMFILETALGQFMKKGGVGSWNIAPLLKGVGIGCFLIIIYCNIYYIVVMAWSVLYFFETISHGTLPWTTCDNWWNTDNCMLYDGTSATSNSSLLNVTVSPADSAFNQTMATDEKKTLAIVEYWNNFILRRSEGFHEPGDLGNWPLMLCYIGSWIICYFCTFKGVKSTGKVVYFTATFPYFVLVVLLVKGCTLPGALDGVRYYLQPNITKLAEPQANMPTSVHKLKESFRRAFPNEAKKLEACNTQEEIDQIHQAMIVESKRKLKEELEKTGIESFAQEIQDLTKTTDRTAPIPLTEETFEIMKNATGDEIKQQIHILIDGLERLKGMEKDDPALVTMQIILAGALGIGLVSTSTVAAKLISGFIEYAAALAGVEVATVTIVCAIATVVVVTIIIPIIYFMQKPANCICLLINELDAPLVLAKEDCIHGKTTLMTSPIPPAVDLGPDKMYPVSGLIACEKRSAALVGSKYRFVMRYKEVDLGFAVECPLTGIDGDNNCYCAFTSDPKACAEASHKLNKTSWEATKGNLCISIKCNSGSGSIAYYIARAYKV